MRVQGRNWLFELDTTKSRHREKYVGKFKLKTGEGVISVTWLHSGGTLLHSNQAGGLSSERGCIAVASTTREEE